MAKTSLEDKIVRLEADLKEAKARKHVETRKARNAQLVAFGIMLETQFNKLPVTERAKIRSWADGLDKRNRERALAGFERLDETQKRNIAEYEEAGPERLFTPLDSLKTAGTFTVRPDMRDDEL